MCLQIYSQSDADVLLLLFSRPFLFSANICSCHVIQFLSFDVLFYNCKYVSWVLSVFFFLKICLSFASTLFVRSFWFCRLLVFPVLLRNAEVYFRKAPAMELSICRKQTHIHAHSSAAAHQQRKTQPTNSNGNSVSTWHYSMCVKSISFVSLQIWYW